MTSFTTPSSRFRTHMGASGKKWSRAEVARVGRTMNRATAKTRPASMATPVIQLVRAFSPKRVSTQVSNLLFGSSSSSG